MNTHLGGILELSGKSSCLHPVFGPPFTPYPLFPWYLQSNENLLNLSMKLSIECIRFETCYSLVVQVRAVKGKRKDRMKFSLTPKLMVYWGLRSLGWKTPPSPDLCVLRFRMMVALCFMMDKSPWQGTLPKCMARLDQHLVWGPTLRLYTVHKTGFQWMMGEQTGGGALHQKPKVDGGRTSTHQHTPWGSHGAHAQKSIIGRWFTLGPSLVRDHRLLF
jgi:hypothetical protein